MNVVIWVYCLPVQTQRMYTITDKQETVCDCVYIYEIIFWAYYFLYIYSTKFLQLAPTWPLTVGVSTPNPPKRLVLIFYFGDSSAHPQSEACRFQISVTHTQHWWKPWNVAESSDKNKKMSKERWHATHTNKLWIPACSCHCLYIMYVHSTAIICCYTLCLFKIYFMHHPCLFSLSVFFFAQ